MISFAISCLWILVITLLHEISFIKNQEKEKGISGVMSWVYFRTGKLKKMYDYPGGFHSIIIAGLNGNAVADFECSLDSADVT
jgi:hypothetical protein